VKRTETGPKTIDIDLSLKYDPRLLQAAIRCLSSFWGSAV
jgi:hypothetical protein